MTNERQTKKSGDYGEELAARFLKSRGYEIIEQNYHSKYGEIDIIAKNDRNIAFVEVKSRSSEYCGLPREAVTPAKQRKIIRTAYAYLIKNESDLSPRFDVIEVYFNNKTDLKPQKLTHIKSAFEPDGRDDYSLL